MRVEVADVARVIARAPAKQYHAIIIDLYEGRRLQGVWRRRRVQPHDPNLRVRRTHLRGSRLVRLGELRWAHRRGIVQHRRSGRGPGGHGGFRSFLSFKREGLPANLTVLEAKVWAYQTLCTNDPYSNGHGPMRLQNAGYGPSLTTSAYNSGVGDPASITLSSDASLGWKSATVMDWVRFGIENGVAGGAYWQMKVYFQPTNVADGTTRRCTLVTPTSPDQRPYLDVTFTVP